MSTRTAVFAAALLAAASPAVAQSPRTAVVPDTVTVGEVFRVAVRVDVPAGGGVRFEDTLAVAGELENAEPARRFDEAGPDGGHRVTAVYRLSAWRPGRWTLPDAALRLESPDGSVRSLTVPLPAVHVRSVLPSDTSGIEPREARGVIGADRLLWPWIAGAALFAAAVIAASVLLVRRLRRAARADPPPGSPRERALAALDDVRREGLLDGADAGPAVARIGEAVRGYLAETHPRLGRELTTSELLVRARDRLGERPGTVVARVLRAADRVKFAALRPDASEARAIWAAARDWIAAQPGDARAEAGKGREAESADAVAAPVPAPPEAGAA